MLYCTFNLYFIHVFFINLGKLFKTEGVDKVKTQCSFSALIELVLHRYIPTVVYNILKLLIDLPVILLSG